jgi:hypothetical protein
MSNKESTTENNTLDREAIQIRLNNKEPVEQLIKEITLRNFNNTANIFIPGRHFPALSVTGANCSLGCEHCNKSYLSHMMDASSKTKLRESLDTLVSAEAQGCLISGGCDADGKVPLLEYKDVFHEYKEKTDLIFNFHAGLLNEDEIKQLADFADIVSFDFTLDEEIIKNIYHLDRKPEDYMRTLENMMKHNIRVVPHINIGLNYGSIKEEIVTLEYLSKFEFELIVFIILIPPEGDDRFTEPRVEEIGKVLTEARLKFPKAELSLGCMRPRSKIRSAIEDAAIKAGINRFEIPLKKTIRKLTENGMKLNTYHACCAIPLSLYRP